MTLPLFAASQPGRREISRWQQAASLPPARKGEHPVGLAGAVSGLLNDRLLVGGGANFPDTLPWMGGHKKYHDNVYEYAKRGGRVRFTGLRFTLPEPIAYAACCTTPGGIVYAGGENEQGISRKAWLLSQDPVARFHPLPDLPIAVSGASATAVNGRVYLAGGETASGSLSQFLVLDVSDPQKGWQSLSPLPVALSYGLLLNDDSCLYLAGGRFKSAGKLTEFYKALYRYSPERDQWSFVQELPAKMAAGTGIGCGKKGLLLIGGDPGETFNRVESLLLAIAAETDAGKKQQLVQQKNELQAAHPGFSREAWFYDLPAQRFNKAGTLPYPSPVTTIALRWGSSVVIPGGEIRAGIRSAHILTAKLPAWLR